MRLEHAVMNRQPKFIAAITLLLAIAPALGGETQAGSAGRETDELFDAGREAYRRGDHQATVRNMLEVVVRRPNDARARSYLKNSSRVLAGRRRADIRGLREEAVEGLEDELEFVRSQTSRWRSDLEAAWSARLNEQWLVACDRYLNVLQENPKHEEAQKGLAAVHRKIASKIDQGWFRDVKKHHLYRAFFHYLQREGKDARREFEKAMTYVHWKAELPDATIQQYLEKLGWERPPAMLALQPRPSPVAAEQSRPPKQAQPKQAPPKQAPPKQAPPQTAHLQPAPRQAEPPKPKRPAAAAPGVGAATPGVGAATPGVRAAAPRVGAAAPGVGVAARRPRRAPAPPPEFNLVTRRADQLFQRGNYLQQQGKFEEAVRTFGELVALQPDYPGAQERAYLASEDLKAERARLKESAEQHYQDGLASYGAGKFEAARQEWEKAVAADPGHPYAMRALGRVQRDIKEFEQ